MMALIQHNLPILIAALLIGLATAWWTIPRRDSRSIDQRHEDSTER